MYTRAYVEQTEGVKFPGKTFEECILEPVFEIQRDYFYKPFIQISKAHAVMLFEQGIIRKEEAVKILEGLVEIDRKNFDSQKYDPAYEDMFFMIESLLEEEVGSDTAGRLHIARSRNDIDICEFRMVLREKVLDVMDALNHFRGVILRLIEENVDTVMPAYTHTQPAQPTTLAHYLLSFYDALERNYGRFTRLVDTINKSPLGAAAITTTGFNISRRRTAELLGFDGLVENSYDSIAGCDYLTECASVLMILNIDLSRFLKDTLDFCTREFNVFYLSDPYVQVSSIMPQKRNPSSLEHARPMNSKALGEAKCVFDILHNTPYGDIVDTEEQLQPHLYSSIQYTLRVLKIASVVFATLKVNKEVLLQRAHEGCISFTELADVLVREKGLSFRHSHKITGSIVRHLIKTGLNPADITSALIDSIAHELFGYELHIDDETIQRAIDPVNFVGVRTITGGPAPSETQRMLEERKDRITRDRESHQKYKAKLKRAEELLEETIKAIL